ncbi:hypothetical protein E5843_00240 [Luteimonas yindakuii]|uniref:hypothetical protein n=1 Tax=Luteimonas yindakuii TaxID=2565782 RepID=UPI0010A4499B|nr:hypothetical protein [Luteimonas yindakuii]QCO66618.1 hypothetical protein E5843_00240 [Luteimonas yindakuii]
MTATRQYRLLALAAAIACATTLGACKRDQPATATPPASAPAPADPVAQPANPVTAQPTQAAMVSEVVLGTAATGNERVAEPKTTFARSDRTIVASVVTRADTPTATDVRARWTFQDGQLVDETSQRLELSGPGVTNFRINNQEDWPAGTYTVEISMDGNVVQSQQFTVQ